MEKTMELKGHLPKIFHETLTRQFGEIIRQTEELIDKGYILMTYQNLYDLLAAKSEKVKNYDKFETYAEWFDLDRSDDMSTLNEAAFNIQKTYFIKTEEELKISEAIISVLNDDLDYSHYAYEDIYYFKDISSNEGLHLFQTPTALSSWGTIWHEFYDFKKTHKIAEEICNSSFLLDALATAPIQSDQPFELISLYVAKNYIQNVISSINYDIDIDRETCSFLLKEIYKATRLYTLEDIDRHVTTDIPVYPYTQGKTEVLGVYYYKPDDTDVCEYLFITAKDCFSVHMKVDYPYRDWFHTIQVLEFGSLATVFGSERTITVEELNSLDGIVIGETPIRYVDDFNMNEASLLDFCKNKRNQHLNSEIADYYVLLKGAWLQSPHQLNNNYRVSIEGLARERFYDNGRICLTEEEKALQSERVNEGVELLSQNHQADENVKIILETEVEDFDDFDFGSPNVTDDHSNDFGIKEPIPAKRCNRMFKACLLLLPVVLISVIYFAL
jgi:hypothetical protein